MINEMEPLEDMMELILPMALLLGAAVLGSWRIEHDFDDESKKQPVRVPADSQYGKNRD